MFWNSAHPVSLENEEAMQQERCGSKSEMDKENCVLYGKFSFKVLLDGYRDKTKVTCNYNSKSNKQW